MHRIHKHVSAAVSVLYFLSALLFFALQGYGHMLLLESSRAFEPTRDFFVATAGVPGGLSDWLGCLASAAYVRRWVGALLNALLVVGVQLLVWCLSKRKSFISYSISFIPSIAVWASLCHLSLTGSAIAILMVMLVAMLVKSPENRRVRYAVIITAVPVLYVLAGPLALLFAGLASVGEKDWRLAVPTVLLAAACPFISYLLFDYSLPDLVAGLHYGLVPRQGAVLVWVAAALVFLCVLLASLKWSDARNRTRGWIGSAILMVLASMLPQIIYLSSLPVD